MIRISRNGDSGPEPETESESDNRLNDWEILRAIWAIPSSVLSGQAKTLLCVHVDHCGFGRSTSFASNETLALESGVQVAQISRMNAALVHGIKGTGKPDPKSKRKSRAMRGGWLIEVRLPQPGKRATKFNERYYKIGPTTTEWINRGAQSLYSRRRSKEIDRDMACGGSGKGCAPSASAEAPLRFRRSPPCASAEAERPH